MSVQLATLPPSVDRAPEPRDALAGNSKPHDGAFSHAMQQAGDAEVRTPSALPHQNKTTAASRDDAAHDAGSAGQADIGALMSQLMPQAMNQAAPAAQLGAAAAQAQTAQASAHDSADSAAPADLAAAISPLLANRMPAAGPLSLSVTPMLGRLAANSEDGRPGSLPASRASSAATSLAASLSDQQAASTDGQRALTALLARSARQSTDGVLSDRPAAPAAPGPDASWAAVLGNVSDRGVATGNASLALPPHTPTQWREPLLNALGERVQWQLQRGNEQAVIRLEPPNLGSIDIVIRQEAGQMQVHLSATHRDVAQQLQGISDGLRHELSLRQAADVNVQVSDQSASRYQGQGQGRQGDQQSPTRQPGRALEAANEPDTTSGFSMQADQG